ncbi:MAG: hypothetical protein AAGJ85_07340, partial [Pseudomonadota bacterium]
QHSIGPPAFTIETQIGGRDVYRRDVRRPDGRYNIFYGYAPHSGESAAEPVSEVAKGGELRWHPLREEWNVYVPHRQNRTFKPSAADDPLSPTRAGGPITDIPFTDFELCIFENRFTSLHMEAPEPSAPPYMKSDRAIGRCDVVVYTPERTGNLFSIGQERRRLLLAAWIDRYQTLFAEGHKFVMPFESRGEEVGVTLSHPHGQIYSFPFVPDTQAKAGHVFSQGYDLTSALDQDADIYEVTRAGDIRAWCPPYARYPFETWLVPTRKQPGPWTMTEEEADGFTYLLGDITQRMDRYFGRDTAYMLSLQASPAGYEGDWHFWAQFYPILRAPDRVKYLASVESHSGVFTVDVMPEFAAKTLRAQIS